MKKIIFFKYDFFGINALFYYPTGYQFEVKIQDLDASDSYKIFDHRINQIVHEILSFLWQPMELSSYFAARIIEPFPGENKSSPFWTGVTRIYTFALTCLFGAIGIALFPFLILPHLWNHSHRKVIQYINVSNSYHPITQNNSLHLRTHNIALGPASFVALTDLRDTKTRAKELVDSILEDKHAPQFLVFQEAYNQVEELTRLKEKYPYILHSIAPNAFGLSSGFFVASKHPIVSVKFQSLEMENPEKWIARGCLKVRLKTAQPLFLDIYALHLQALLGKERADRRLEQLQFIKDWMETDYRQTQDSQILMGDFNTSHLTFLGENNTEEKQPEKKVLDFLEEHFDDCYATDHNVKDGKRTHGQPYFLPQDNYRMQTPNLPEPRATLVFGPLANPGKALTLRMARDRETFGYPKANVVEPMDLTHLTWGTPNWHEKQMENPARLDHAIIPKVAACHFRDIRAEIRRIPIPNKESAVSDHLPLDLVLTHDSAPRASLVSSEEEKKGDFGS